MGIICPPLVGIGLTDLANIGRGGGNGPPGPLVPASLSKDKLQYEQKWNRVDTWLIYLQKTGPLIPICSNGSAGADQAARRKSLVATDDLGISQKKVHNTGVTSGLKI